MAISSPLLETSINGARGVIVNVTGSMDMGLEEVTTATDMIREVADPDALFIFGAAFDENMDDELCITVIATGFDDAKPAVEPPANPFSRKSGDAPASPAPTAPKPLNEEPKGGDDGDDFDAIIKIFSKGK